MNLLEHVHYLPGDYTDTAQNWTDHGIYLGHTAGLGQQWSHGFQFRFAGGTMPSSNTRWVVGLNGCGHVMSGALTLTLLAGATGQWTGYAILHGSAEKLVAFDRWSGLPDLASAVGAQLVMENGAIYTIASAPAQEPGTDLWTFLINSEDGFAQGACTVTQVATLSSQMDYMRDFVAALGASSVTGIIRFRWSELDTDYVTLINVASDRKWNCVLKGGDCSKVSGMESDESPFAGYTLQLDYWPVSA